jgi:hypothetical protein
MYDPVLVLVAIWAWGMLLVHLSAYFRKKSEARLAAPATDRQDKQEPAGKTSRHPGIHGAPSDTLTCPSSFISSRA